MLASKTSTRLGQQARMAPAKAARASRISSVVVSASSNASTSSSDVNRRQLFVGAGAALGLAMSGAVSVPLARADGEYELFLGYATPPTSYGGYGGNAKEAPKYTFEYPTGWKEEVPSKVEKGTQGVDGRVVNPRVKGQRAVVITLGRAGEDNKSFRLTDLDSTFQGFAGADYDLQDALSAAGEIKKSSREVDGQAFFDYDIDSPDTRYLATITTKNGKVFALFVKTPAKAFRSNEEKLRHIIETFKLL